MDPPPRQRKLDKSKFEWYFNNLHSMTLSRILAVIPARGGSKGVPHKNIRPFVGKPLLVHTIETAKAVPAIDRIIVTTDDSEISHIAHAAGAEVPLLRPAELSNDTSRVADAVIHLLEWLKINENYEPSHVLLLQPTSPLRTAEDIERAIRLFQYKNADSLVSVCRTENILLTKDSDDTLSVVNPEQSQAPNRQELSPYYRLDGSMIYLIKTKTLQVAKSFLAGKLVGYEIDRWRAVDIDEPQDFVLGELVYRNKSEIVDRIKNFKL